MFTITLPHLKGNLILNNLYKCFEALWPKILIPDLKMSMTLFFIHESVFIYIYESVNNQCYEFSYIYLSQDEVS